MRALWEATTVEKFFLAPLTDRPFASGFLNIPREYRAWFPSGDRSQPIECVLDLSINPAVLQFSPEYCRIPGGLTDWYRTINARPGDKIRVEVLRTGRKYRLSLVKPGQESLRSIEVFDGLGLHRVVREACCELFKDGHYAQAVREGFVAMNNYIKERCARPTLDGTPLMEAVFAPNRPLLSTNSGRTDADRHEREGILAIARASILAIRNSLSHETLSIEDSYLALEYLGLASLLCKISEKARRSRPPRVPPTP